MAIFGVGNLVTFDRRNLKTPQKFCQQKTKVNCEGKLKM